MDKLDAWMKRAFSLEKPEEISSTSKKKITFSKANSKNESFKKKQERKQENRKKFRRGKNPSAGNKNPALNNFSKNQTTPGFGKSPATQNFRKPSATPGFGKSPATQNFRKKSTSNNFAKKRSNPQIARTENAPNNSPNYSPNQSPNPAQKSRILKGKLKIIPLGGLNEVGKNMMALEYEDDIIIVDMGFEFPGENMFGIDYIIPDISYLEENKKRIRGVVITHGHLDHIGGIPYIIPKLDYPPIYATKLSAGLIVKRAEEFKQVNLMKLHTIDPDQPLKLGAMLVRFFRVSHSIPDAVGLDIDTPIGKIVFTGDFKFDDAETNLHTRADNKKIEDLGKRNVLALFCDSTNSLKEGHSMPEKEVGKVLYDAISQATGRIIVASFSSQIGRIQQVIDASEKCGKKIFISGRSMRTNMDIASKLGYLKFKPNSVEDIKKYSKKDKIKDENTLIITTGSQGEPVSALTRMANKEHPNVQIKKGDTIILSSSPIVGNERAIYTVINKLSIMGAKVIHNQIMDVHTSGHGKQDELKRMIKAVNPKYLIPAHGEYYMRQALGDLAKKTCNIPQDRIIMIRNGDVLVGEKGKITISDEKIKNEDILIDGKGHGHMGSQVQTEREMMSQNGALMVLVYIDKKTKKIKKEPDVTSRGFIYLHEANKITGEISKIARESYDALMQKDPKANRSDIKTYVKMSIDRYARKTLERKPLIIPLVIEL